MEVVESALNGILVIKPRIFTDDRGYFFESFNQQKFEMLTGLNPAFVQDNQSRSHKNVLRGLHFQNPPHAQGKLVRVTQGSVLDVVVDIRKESSSYGQYFSQKLSAENQLMMWIPEGFAHGFLSLEDDTVFLYKCTNYYHQPSERSLSYNDPDLNINWNCEAPVVSPKDLAGEHFINFESRF